MTAVHLSGRVAVITGANSGIGRATARALSQAGAHVVLAARTRSTLEAVALECSHNGAQALAIPTDVCNEPDIEALMTRSGRGLLLERSA